MNGASTNKAFHPVVVVSFWMAVAFLLRIFGISHESLWWDEYTSHVYLDSPTLADFLWMNRTLDPLTLPVYYCLEYLWTHYVTGSVYGLRLLSIFIGLATLPMVYGLGRRIYGRRAGYVATALLALSPVHIHHSQSIRMYVVFVFLAVAAVFSFLRLLERPGWRPWLLHGMVSILLYWTHPFAGLIPAALGCFLLLRYRSRTVVFWGWTLLQALLFAPTLFYLSTVRFWPKDSTSLWIMKPGFGALLADLFFDDVSAFHWQFRLNDFAQRVAAGRLALDVLFAVLILFLLLRALRECLYRTKSPTDQAVREQKLLLVVWLLLPPLMLFVVSYLLRPCMFPRYTVHCIIPLYLLAGGAVTSIKSTVWNRTLIACLIGSMFLQWLWLQPGPQRTDWRTAGILLHEEAGGEDIVLVENFLWRDVFTHNLNHLTKGPLPLPVAAGGTQQILAAQAALCTGTLAKQASAGHSPHVWAVLALGYFDPGWPAAFEQCLHAWGISFERRALPSIRKIALYKLTSTSTVPVATMEELFAQWRNLSEPAASWDGSLDHTTLQSFGDLASELALHGRPQMARGILDALFSFEHSPARDIYGNLYAALETGGDVMQQTAAVKKLWMGYGFRENGQTEYACRAFKEAVSHDGRYALACFELGKEYYDLRRYHEAAEAFALAAAADGRYHMLDSLVRALRTGGRIEEAFEAVQTYREGIGAQSRGEYEAASRLLRQAAAADPHLDDAYTSLAFVLIVQRKIEETREVLNAYLALDGTPAPGAYGLLAVVYIARNELDKALEYAEKAFTMDESYARQFSPFFYAFLRDRDYNKTVEAMEALKAEGVDLYPLVYEYVAHLLQ